MADLTFKGSLPDENELLSILNREIQNAIHRIAEQLNLPSERRSGPEASSTYRLVCQAYQARREREDMFDADLFADPAWDILLALFCSHLADRQMTLQDAIKSAAVPESTARRWLTALERRGLIRSVAHEDRVQLTPSAISKLEAYVERLRKKSLMRVI